MNKNIISPYIRLAIHSTIQAPFFLTTRTLYDYELIYIKDGVCKLKIDDTDYICKKNNVVFLRPGIAHSLCIENTDLIQPHIHFDAVYSEKSHTTPISFKPLDKMNDEEISLIQTDIFSETNIPYVFYPSTPQAFQKLFFNIIDTFNTVHSDLELKSMMMSLLDMLILQFEESTQTKIEVSDISITNIKNYIDNNYHSIITLDMLANMYHINKFTLMRKFKNTYGINIIEYYNIKRVNSAKKTLIKTNMSIKAIGEALNFTDAYSFSRFFKSHTGVSPEKFRKNKLIES